MKKTVHRRIGNVVIGLLLFAITFSAIISCITPVVKAAEVTATDDGRLILDEASGEWRYYEGENWIADKYGLIEHEGGKFLVINGRVAVDVHGATLFGETFYFFSYGMVQEGYTGLALYDNEWFYVVNGMLQIEYNGLVEHDGGIFVVAAGRIVSEQSGLVSLDDAWYYVLQGQVQTDYTGVLEYNGTQFQIVEGKVVQDSDKDSQNSSEPDKDNQTGSEDDEEQASVSSDEKQEEQGGTGIGGMHECLKCTSLEINEAGYWVINGEETSYKADYSEEITKLYEALGNLFRLESSGGFKSIYKSNNDPTWCYTSSTFSGWGGSIGRPEEIDTIRFKVRARDKAITKIKVFLCENDKNGAVLYSETLEVMVNAREAKDVYWKLPELFKNTEDKSLYFAYNCDNYCDLWSNTGSTSNIPESEYQAVLTYTTQGKQLESPAKMVNVVSSPCKYLYAEIGYATDVFVYKTEPATATEEFINVFLSDKYELVVDDNFQLFYRGVVQAVNPYNYHIKISCQKGSAYPRYYEWTPKTEDIGEYKLTLSVYDDNNNLLGTDDTTLIVKAAVEPTEELNVLCFGDSLTSGGVWPAEAYRRLTQTGGTPNGLGFANVHFVGSKTKSVGESSIGYEGVGGWTWATYLSDKSPFYDAETGANNFTKYCEKNNISDIDVVYILLTWNGQGYSFKTDYSLESEHFKNAQQLINQIHSEYPEAIIRCMGIQMPSQNGGTGKNYGASGGYSDAYGLLVTAMHYNKTLEEMCNQSKYAEFVKYVDVAGQFDTDYNMPSAEKNVNNRSSVKETVGTNGVHPATAGYYQIADAVYRSLVGDINTYFVD